MAVCLSGHTVQSGGVESTLFLTHPSSRFTQGTVLYTFQPRIVGQSSVFGIEFQEACPNDTFSIDQTTGVLSVIRTIDYNQLQSSLEPMCVQGRQNSEQQDYFITLQTFYCFVTIDRRIGIPVVIDVIPELLSAELMFLQTFYSSHVVEGVANATVTTAGLLQAVSQPIMDAIVPNYHIIGEHSGDFTVVQSRTNCKSVPAVVTLRPLYRSLQLYYNLTLEAYTPSLSARTTIAVQVLDINDESPQFVSAPESLTLPEDTPIGVEFGRFMASDMDVGLNGKVRYSTPGSLSLFSIHPLSGSLFLFSPITTLQPSAQLTISATDLGAPPRSVDTNVTVSIESSNIFPPVIVIHSLGQVPELALLGLVVGTIEVMPSNSSLSVSVTLVNNGPCECLRLSDATTAANGSLIYDVEVSGAFDFEMTPNGIHIFTLNATDALSSTVEQEAIEITNVNEAPGFAASAYTVEVFEGIPVGSEIAHITASDPDKGSFGVLSYSISGTDPNRGLLAIHSTSGTIYTTGELDYENISSIQITLTAQDSEQEEATATVTVNILDRNDNIPVFTSAMNSTVTIPERQGVNQPIFHFTVSDVDGGCNGAVEYSIIHAEPQAFRIDSFSGLLFPMNESALDYETFQSAKVVVRATDLGSDSRYSIESSLFVTLTDVDDEAPVIDSIDCPCFIREDESASAQCFSLSAQDKDSTFVQFSITSGNHQDFFRIDPTSGVISTTQALNREQHDSFMLSIVASDSAQTSQPETLTIVIVDANEPPMYPSTPISITIPQNLNIGDFVGNIAAMDSDVGFNGVTLYEFEAGTSSMVTTAFHLDRLSGDLITGGSLSTTTYSFTVVARDITNSASSTSATVVINVAGLKNNPPSFVTSADRRVVPADLPPNSFIAQLSATDEDSGSGANGLLTYSIVGGNHSSLFSVNSSGAIIAAQSLSSSASNVYVMNISATDSGFPQLRAYQEFIIEVYSTATTVAGIPLVHNPAVSDICHFNNSVIEMTDSTFEIASLPSVGSQATAYTVLQSNVSNAFTITLVSQSESLLQVRTGFANTVFTNRELIFLTLLVQYGNNFHLCSVTVVINDINNNPALFVSDSFSIDVYSGTPVGSAIYQLEAVDADIGMNAQMQFSLPSSRLPFTLDRDSGVLTLSSSLDQSSYTFSATVTDNMYLPRQTSTATVQVTVLQTTNNPPTLISVPPLNITETTSVGHVIAMLSATDPDAGVHRDNRFCILSGNEYNAFRVTRSGQLVVHRELDYESFPHHYDLMVRAYDSSDNPQYADTSVSIDITDENDEAPVFSTTIYTATVMENQMSGLHIITVSAVDRDDGTNGEVRYSLSGASLFSIDAQSGMIRTTSILDREVASMYAITVIATDQTAIESQRLSSSAELRILVLDENDENPVFSTPSNTRQDVREDMSIGSEIIQLLASDGDDGANAKLKYSIVSGNDDFTFSLDPWTGSLSLARSLDFESSTRNYVLGFQVTDLGAPPRSAASTLQLFLDVVDVNDNYPVFSSDVYECSFMESVGTLTAFDSDCQVGATDADGTSSSIMYSIVTPPAGLPFEIHEQTGVLSIVGLADAEAFSHYVIRVQAADSGTPSLSTTALVVVTVRDANDNLAVFGDPISTLYIPELTPDNSLLFFAHALDRDLTAENSNISYQIFRGSGFHIHPRSGAVFLDGTLDAEESEMHQLTILGADPVRGSSSQKTFNIQVVDINENSLPPTFPAEKNPSIVAISRAAAQGTLVTTITAIDTEGGTISYHIVGGTGYGYFHIGLSNGSITVSYPLTSVEDNELNLIVRADDGGRFPLTSEFRLTVVFRPDENTKPFFVAPVFYANPSESTASEEIFTHIRAEVNGYTDPSVCYSITGGNEAGMFAINASTGAVYKTLVGNLDRELVSSYNLSVTASKPGVTDTSTALLIIELADANDFRPGFVSTDFNVSVFETHPVDPAQPFVRVFAIDNDSGENGRLSYSIQSSGMVPFAISETTGYVHLTSAFNRSVSSYTVTVVARDHGAPALDGMTTLTVNVITPAPVGAPVPIFSPTGQQMISEGTVPRTSLITYTPQNPSSTLLYRFLDNTDQFAISPNSGEVFLTRSLDREAQSSASYTIVVTDGPNTVTLVLPIVVLEVNEHRPQFTQDEFQITVMENFPNNRTFGSITATDPEGAIVYSLVDSQDPRSLSLFDISSDGSVHTLFSEIDREEIPVHILTVAVRDFGDTPLFNYVRLIISVIDINDNGPTFEDTEIFIPENMPISTSIFQVTAFDPDERENAQVLYSLTSTNPLFLVNTTSGDIILTSSLDAEMQQQHTLVISTSNPDGLQASQVNIVVNIIDALDSTPILPNPGTVTVQENLPMYTFVTSLADTANISRPVFYSIVDGNTLGHFFIEALTGILRTTTELDREAVPSYQLAVQGAFESGFEANVSFTVTVGDVNDQTPQFPSAYLSYSIPENASLNVPLISLNVIDLDEDSNALYVISDGVAASFFSVSASGYLMLTQNLDRESQFMSITFEIYAIDTDYPNSYSSAWVHIDIIDSNDNSPQFQYSEYNFTISTPTRINLPFPGVQVMATDPDQGVYAEVRYEISGGNGTSKFGINRVTGEITVTNNYQLQPQYLLTVSAIDGGGQRSNVQVTIFVKACGFHNLLFLPASFMVEINENVAMDTDVITPNNVNILLFNEPAQLVFSLPIFNPVFGVDSQTGRVFTNGEIDREENDVHYLVLQAVDSSNPQRLAQAEIEVRVLDINDNSPVFQAQNYVASVFNTATPGTEVIRVSALDDDTGTNSDIIYSLIDAPASFRIDPDSGAIFVDSTVNTAQLGSSVTLMAVATDQGNSPHSVQINVVINIVDSNAPRFTRSVYQEEVSEGIDLGTPIVTVAVNVSSNNPSITFRLDSNDPFLPLSLGFFDGVVTVVDPGFDYESVQSYTVSILAEDSTTSLTGQARLEITILDENDNTPIFDAPGSFYTSNIDENVDTGTFTIQVSASDIDSPTNAQITYRLNPNSQFLNTFSVDSSNGVIRTIGSIDYELHPVYELEIMAEDSGVPQRTGLATVRIITNNLNDNPPVFTESVYQDSVSETARVGTGLLFVTATDPDRLNSVTYAIVPVGVGHENFAINSNGLISIQQTLSGSSVFTYTLNISAFDGELYGYATVVIELENTNDNSPMFNQSIYTGSVVEGSPRGRYVTRVFATDNDRGSNGEITYSVSSALLFSIDSQSGIITTASGGSTIDRELTPSFQFSVVARDGGGRIGTARVDVTVEDVNDNAPRFLQTNHNNSIIESAPVGTPVLSLNVSDADVGENSRLIFTAFPTNIQLDQFPFSIDSTGLVRVSIPLDFTVASNYIFDVRVRDNGTVPLFASENATVTIHIQDDVTNNPPRFLEGSYEFSVPETSRQGDSVGIIAVDEATRMNCLIVYTLLPLLDQAHFSIMGDISENGIILLASSLDTGDYNIVVEAQCLNPLNFMRISGNIVSVTVQIYDVNTNPTFNNFLYSGMIPENSSLLTPVPLLGFSPVSGMPPSPRDIEVEDGDNGVNGTVTYLIADRESLMIPFDIGLLDGIIRVAGELDFESRSDYTITVIAMDGGTPALSAVTSVTIAVIDVNDSPPEFERAIYRVEIPEDTAINTTVHTVQASDNDTSAAIIYRLSGEVFAIDEMTGEISIAQSLDREVQSVYTLLVLANDGLFSDNATVVISVTDVNDNPPIFNESLPAFSLVENYPRGETIVQVFATDADEGENADITYSIAEQPDNGEVTIDPSTGEVSFLVSPDFEASPRLEFQVAATDIGGLQDFTTIAINLLDLNDNRPMFTSQSYSASVTEHSADVSNVVRVEAIDADSGINGNVTYRIEGNATSDFTISATGVILTRRAFDREMEPFFDITVTASDQFNLSSSVMVRVNITDINDQRPTFPQSVYQVSVSEAEPANFVILTTAATDGDVGTNARITYALSGENHNEFLRVAHSNGSVSIVLANQLNRERLASYTLMLRAIDGGIPQMDSTVIIQVAVLDVNDNCPEFREPRYSETIPENIAVGTTILSVEAFDRDSGGQTQLIYSIRDASLAPEISIDQDTGDISIASSLDFETRPVYTLMVDVSDGDENCQPTPAIVNITLSDVNDNPPHFFPHEQMYSINENNNPRVLLVTFSADDQDSVSDRGRITFSIESGDVDEAFTINSVSGDLSSRRSLDREQTASYNLVISAADNGSPSLTGTTNVTIIVNDLNDNAPTGGRQDIYIYLLNGTAPLITLGQVYVNDSDLVNDHSFMIQNTNGALEINANDGSIRIGTTTPELGTHLFQVMITDANNTPALTNITARIQSISESTLTNSFVMQFDSVTPQAFTDLVLAKFLSRVAAVVNSTLQTSSIITPIEIQVFSIQASSIQSTNVDIIVAAQNLSSDTYIHPELIQHIIQVNEEDLENYLGASIHTELVDLCRDSTCDSNQVCSNTYSYSSSDSMSFGTRSVTYLGLTSDHSTTCSEILPSPCDSIECPEPSYCATEQEEAVCYDDCSTEPCLNGGTCILQNPGYYCVCPDGYDGRNCEQTSATFIEGTYAVFPLSNSRLEGSFSIDFITDNRNGLLAFVGRYDNDFGDFISIELIDGRPSLRVSYGSNSQLLLLELLLNDRQWHTISVQYNSTVSINTNIISLQLAFV